MTNANEEFEHAVRLHHAGRFVEAAEGYRRIPINSVHHADALCNLSAALLELGQPEPALTACRQSLQLKPGSHEAHCNLANILSTLNRPREALAACQSALAFAPNNAELLNNTGNALNHLGRFDEALAAYRRALEIRPDLVQALSNAGGILARLGRLDEAVGAFRRCLEINPDHAAAASNLAAALNELGRTDQALVSSRQAIALRPHDAHAYNNYGNALKDAARIDEALHAYQMSLSLNPTDAAVHSNLIYTMQFHAAYDEAGLFHQQRQWNELHALPVQSEIRPHLNERSPDRRLKIGYVSPYLFSHAESFFTTPLLEHHDHAQFEIHCYASVYKPDDVTARSRAAVDVWHECLAVPDAELAAQIRADEIDILIDLSMHMSHNRLRMFAMKPAPIQIAWLAYPGGTGLDAMDYRVTDPFLDPPKDPAEFYSEQPITLDDYWACFDPLSSEPPAAPRGNRPIRFGSLNNPCKMNGPLLDLWGKVLLAVPDSTLLLQAISKEHQNRSRGVFESAGVAGNRIEFAGRLLRPEYLRLYDQIDICLDPLPYNGITTSCDALWMGVPVVTLRGKTAAGRAGVGILTAVGLPDLIARDEKQFVEIATRLAGNWQRLNHLRSNLRQTMVNSPLMDAAGFARKMESAYRQAWIECCKDA